MSSLLIDKPEYRERLFRAIRGFTQMRRRHLAGLDEAESLGQQQEDRRPQGEPGLFEGIEGHRQ